MGTLAQRPHILLVDETPGILDPIRMLLEEEGYRVSTAVAPPDAARLVELAPDVIIQEVLFQRRPEVGWAALTQMRLTPALARVPVILCTTASGRVTETATAATLDRLGIRVLLKPFMFEDLQAIVADALATPNLSGRVRLVQDDGSGSLESPRLAARLPDSRRSN